MSVPSGFRYLLEEVRVFQRNLVKDSIKRRQNVAVTNRKFKKLDKIKNELTDLKLQFQGLPQEQRDSSIKDVKEYVTNINKYIELIDSSLKSRLELPRTEQTESLLDKGKTSSNDSDSDCSEEEIKMGEKFDLKTATSLLPIMDGTEIVTKQLIEAIRLYGEMLDADGKKLLINYVLKTRISESAKIRLNKTYTSYENLVQDLQSYFISKKSAASLSVQLNNSRQHGKSIEDFGRTIEELLIDLTISQADGNDDSIPILRNVNEKLAINAFANGLQSNDLRTIIKARNYSKLGDAIRGAKDEVLARNDSQPVFHFRSRGSNSRNFSRGSSRFRGNINATPSRIQNNSYNSRYQNTNVYRGRARGSRGNFRSGNNYHSTRGNSRLYYTENVGSPLEDSNSQSGSSRRFFRA